MKLRLVPLALVLLFGSTLAACGSDGSSPPAGTGGSGGTGGTGGTGGAGPEPLVLTWSDCNLFTDGPEFPAECATVAVPLRWERPSDGTIELFVKRLPATQARRGTLWLLDGGPGGGSIGPESDAYLVAAAGETGLDIMIPHHRGTGRSTKLDCAGAAESSEGSVGITLGEWPDCIAELTATWGGDLAAFSTTEAAKDVAGLMEAVRQPGDQTFVMGSSYGTYLANRFLQLFPDHASGVILDSICPPTGCQLDQFDVRYDQVASDFLAMCGEDPDCSAHVGTDPRARLHDLYDSLDAGHCPELGVDRRKLRVILGQLFNDWNNRLAIAPLIYRLERCAPEDVGAFSHMVGALFGAPGDPVGPFLKAWSFPLQNNITFSELWTEPPPSPDAILAAADATLISQGANLDDAKVYPQWPRYPREETFGRWADTDLPMLMMNGDLDPATPLSIASSAGEHFRGAHQHFVRIPRSPHGVLTGSPITPDGKTCGMQLLVAFLDDPEAPLDTACTDQVFSVRFAGAPWLAQRLFGVDDMWENPTPR